MTKVMKAFIWTVVVFGLGAVVGAAVMGTMHRDAEVSSDPYEEGLRWDATQRAASELGIKAAIGNITYSDGVMGIEFKLTGGVVQELSLLASRPAGELADVACDLREVDSMQYDAACDVGAYGLWDLVISFTYKGRVSSITQRVYASQ